MVIALLHHHSPVISELTSSNKYKNSSNFQDYVKNELDTHKIFYSETDYAPDFISSCSEFF